jgi:hypothetical protein
VQVRLLRHAALGRHVAKVDLVPVDLRAAAHAPHVVDRGRPGDPEHPRLERTGPLEARERLIGTYHGVPCDVLGVMATDDRHDVGHQAAPLVVDDGREHRVEIGGR